MCAFFFSFNICLVCCPYKRTLALHHARQTMPFLVSTENMAKHETRSFAFKTKQTITFHVYRPQTRQKDKNKTKTFILRELGRALLGHGGILGLWDRTDMTEEKGLDMHAWHGLVTVVFVPFLFVFVATFGLLGFYHTSLLPPSLCALFSLFPTLCFLLPSFFTFYPTTCHHPLTTLPACLPPIPACHHLPFYPTTTFHLVGQTDIFVSWAGAAFAFMVLTFFSAPATFNVPPLLSVYLPGLDSWRLLSFCPSHPKQGAVCCLTCMCGKHDSDPICLV